MPVDLSPEQEGQWYYADHLGMLGPLTMLDKLRPRSAIISEFGAELRGFHIELVERIAEAIHDKQHNDGVTPMTFVVPGDLTMVYHIVEDKFLCHENCSWHRPEELICRKSREWVTDTPPGCDAPNMIQSETMRAYLMLKEGVSTKDDTSLLANCVQDLLA